MDNFHLVVLLGYVPHAVVLQVLSTRSIV